MNQPMRKLSAGAQHGSELDELRSYAVAAAACFVTTAAAFLAQVYLDAANTVMLFLLCVALVAVNLGRGPAVMSAIASVGLFDFFFVPPRYSFTVADVQYVVTFAVMLVVALVISQLAGGLKRHATQAEDRERQTRALYDVAKTLAGAMDADQALAITREWLGANCGIQTVLLVVAGSKPGAPPRAVGQPDPGWLLLRAVDAAMAGTHAVATDQLGDDRAWLLLPLRTPTRSHGVLAIATSDAPSVLAKSHRPLIDALASVLTATVERLHFVDVAQAAEVRATTERMRSRILSSISHDVRTPLTSLYGLADRLCTMPGAWPESARAALRDMRDQSQRLSGMVSNLLDMARLQGGAIALRRDWQSLEEVVGASIQSLGTALQDHEVRVILAPDLPLVRFDAVLMERVLANLLENAAKYSPPKTVITIDARVFGDTVEVNVCDQGPGFPPGRLVEVFELFARCEPESAVPGMGIGLAICHAIVDAHGGHIRASNREGGGACVAFDLPCAEAPPTATESTVDAASP